MKHNQKGFMGFLVIIVLALIIGGSATYWYLQKSAIPGEGNIETNMNTPVKTEVSDVSSNTDISYGYPNMSIQEPKTQAQSNLTPTSPQSIVWSFDVITKPGEETEIRKEISVTINGKKYKTGVADVGCGTEIQSSQLRSGQLSAIVCGPYAGSATEYALKVEGEGFKLVGTELMEDASVSGGYNRSQSYVAASLKADGSAQQALSDTVFISATQDSQARVMAYGDINHDGYSDAILMVTSCGASCSSDLVVVLNQSNTSAKRIATATFAPAYNSSSAAKSALSYVRILDDGVVALTGSGLACTPPGSELPCTQEKWGIVKTIKYRFEGNKMVQIN